MTELAELFIQLTGIVIVVGVLIVVYQVTPQHQSSLQAKGLNAQ